LQHVPLARFFFQTPTVRNPSFAVRQRTQSSANISHLIAERAGVGGIPASDLLCTGQIGKGIEIFAQPVRDRNRCGAARGQRRADVPLGRIAALVAVAKGTGES